MSAVCVWRESERAREIKSVSAECVCGERKREREKLSIICLHSKRHSEYGVASVSRNDKKIGIFCKRALQKRQYSAKETYDFIDASDRSHPICVWRVCFLIASQYKWGFGFQ